MYNEIKKAGRTRRACLKVGSSLPALPSAQVGSSGGQATIRAYKN